MAMLLSNVYITSSAFAPPFHPWNGIKIQDIREKAEVLSSVDPCANIRFKVEVGLSMLS